MEFQVPIIDISPYMGAASEAERREVARRIDGAATCNLQRSECHRATRESTSEASAHWDSAKRAQPRMRMDPFEP